jgi:S-adenosylmethionine:tRNA ribosyltransferase-isomerase
MQLDDFDYELPPERIAQTPIEPRDGARLLVDQGPAEPQHRFVRDLAEMCHPGDIVVMNDTKVIPARLALSRITGGAVEVLLLDPHDESRRRWTALARPARKLRDGEVLYATDGSEAVQIDGRREDTVELVLLGPDDPLTRLNAIGQMPLPPYITSALDDPDRYQTVYAATPGSSAAPTAGLHLTPELLGRISERGVTLATVELMVGLDTFKPVTAPDPRDHTIHSERYRVPLATLAACEQADRVIAVGTTTVRALESAFGTGAAEGRTRLFIHRGYRWQVVDRMLTNFHLPRTTLLLMIDAFVGPRWRSLYEVALEQQYRFLSFGDAMLLDRHAR